MIFELTHHQTMVLNAVVKQLLEDACVTLAPHAKADIAALYKAVYVIPAANEKPYPRPIDSVLPAIEL